MRGRVNLVQVEGYEVIKKLFSNEHGLAVYEVKKKGDHHTFFYV